MGAYKPQIPLESYVVWFIKRMWRGVGIQPYRDCVTLILRELNMVDRCLIHRTITGEEWFYGKTSEKMFYESLRAGIMIPHTGSVDVKNIPFDITNEVALVWIYKELAIDDFIIWVTKCLRMPYNNIRPLQYLLTQYLDHSTCTMLLEMAVKQDHVEASLLVHARVCEHSNSTNKKISLCRRPNTYAIMHDLGYSFRSDDPKGYLLCVPIDEIPYEEMKNVVTWAMEYPHTKWLDVIHARYSIEEMLQLCDWYYPAGLQWFIEHGVRGDHLNMSVIDFDDFEYLAPLCDDRMRAEMIALGDSEIVWRVVSMGSKYTWDHVWFMRRASYARIQLMQKMMNK
jgi:hypothetical protein